MVDFDAPQTAKRITDLAQKALNEPVGDYSAEKELLAEVGEIQKESIHLLALKSILDRGSGSLSTLPSISITAPTEHCLLIKISSHDFGVGQYAAETINASTKFGDKWKNPNLSREEFNLNPRPTNPNDPRIPLFEILNRAGDSG